MPDPAAYFSWDAVVLDIGPYYVTQLVTMLGPVTEVTARGIVGQEGRDYPVRVPTTVAAILGFESGAQATLTLSLDAWQHSHPPLEIYGTLGTLALPDPNFFGGEPRLLRRQGPVGVRPARRPAVERAQLRAAVRHVRQLPRSRGRGPGRGRSSRTGRTGPTASWRRTCSACSSRSWCP